MKSQYYIEQNSEVLIIPFAYNTQVTLAVKISEQCSSLSLPRQVYGGSKIEFLTQVKAF